MYCATYRPSDYLAPVHFDSHSRTGGLPRAIGLALLPAFSLLVLASFWLPPPASAEDAALRVNGAVAKQLSLSAADLAAMPHQSIKVTDDKGTTALYEGTPVLEILKRAGAPLGKELRGRNMAMCVLAVGSDGYEAVFALPEIDPGFSDQVILVADRRDGQRLNSIEGPLRLVVPRELRHARWVRNLTTLKVRDARESSGQK